MNEYAPTDRQYIAIDLKSFYASVECVERGLDPLDTCLVVADPTRTDKTICLAVSPPLKAYGTGGRPRLFEVVQRVRDVNARRGRRGKSYSKAVLDANRDIAVDYIVAPPRMAFYMEYSNRIFNIYLKYVAPEDIHVYSIDEVFIDVTAYLATYRMTAHELAMTMIRDVLAHTGITATAGIGTNLYLCKIAMDIVAKKMAPDKDGVRIAELDETSYRRILWDHEPLTDFWRVGRGISARLAPYGIRTMGDIARCSLQHEDLLYSLFGINAELLIDHAWGWEPVTIQMVKSYRPESHSISQGRVLKEPYSCEMARNVIMEMADSLSLDLVDKRLLSDQMVMTLGYDRESLTDPERRARYHGRVGLDHYGRYVPVHAHGTLNLDAPSSSTAQLVDAAVRLYNRIVNPDLLLRRLNVTLAHIVTEEEVARQHKAVQLDLFTDYEALEKERQKAAQDREREKRTQQAIIRIKKMFGKNAILKGINYSDGAMQRERNTQIGGHHE